MSPSRELAVPANRVSPQLRNLPINVTFQKPTASKARKASLGVDEFVWKRPEKLKM
jgi:hypothetical protein